MDDTQMGAAHDSQINPGARLYGTCSQRARVVVAGSGTTETKDNDWHLGKGIDRTSPALALGAQNVITLHPTLNTGESLTFDRRYRHSDDDITYVEIDTYPDADFAQVSILAADVSAGTPFSYRDNLDLAGCKKYVRCDVKLNLSRANTDECRIAAVMTLAGFDALPASS